MSGPEDDPTPLNKFADVIVDRVSDNYLYSEVVQSATLSLMIEHGLVTGEQAAQRIEQMSAAIPNRSRLLDDRLRLTTETLRLQDTQPGKGWVPTVILVGLEDPDDPVEPS